MNSEVTYFLRQWSRGDRSALEKLLPLVLDDLRRIAAREFRREGESHTLQPTALVNEVYLRLVDQRHVEWQDRAQFFGVAALLMRRILVDHAKGRKAVKRGGGASRVPYDEVLGLTVTPQLDLVALDDALSHLAQIDERQGRIVELRFFTGMSHEEIAEVLNISVSTVNREWKTARVWLFRELSKRED